MKVIKFWAEWCGPCANYAPVFESVIKKFPDIDTEQIDVDKDPKTAGKYRVMSIPTTLILGKDGEELDRIIGLKNEEELTEIIKTNL